MAAIALTYPSRAYRLVKIKAITTSDVTDGRKYEARKTALMRFPRRWSADANASAKAVVTGTVPNVKMAVFLRAFQNPESVNTAV